MSRRTRMGRDGAATGRARHRPGPPAACALAHPPRATNARPRPLLLTLLPPASLSSCCVPTRVRLWCPRSSRRPGRGTRRAAAAAALTPHAPVATPTIAARRPLRAGAARLGLHARPRVDAVVLDDALHPACGRHDGGPRRERATRWARAGNARRKEARSRLRGAGGWVRSQVAAARHGRCRRRSCGDAGCGRGECFRRQRADALQRAPGRQQLQRQQKKTRIAKLFVFLLVRVPQNTRPPGPGSLPS